MRTATAEELEEGAAFCARICDVLEHGLAGELARTRKPAPSSLEPLKQFAEFYRKMTFIGSPLMAPPETVALFLTEMITDGKSKAAVRAASAALDYAFDVEGIAPPGGHSLVKAALRLNTHRSRLGTPRTEKPEETSH